MQASESRALGLACRVWSLTVGWSAYGVGLSIEGRGFGGVQGLGGLKLRECPLNCRNQAP